MNSAISANPRSDHLTLALFFALLLHAFVVLGISFSPQDYSQAPRHTMDITLVHQRSEQDQTDAKVLAQANQDGGNDAVLDQSAASPASQAVDIPIPSPNQQIRQASAPPVSQQKIDTITVKKEKAVVAETSPQKDIKPKENLPNADELVSRSLALASVSSEIDQFKTAQSSDQRRRLITTKTKEFRDAAYFESWQKKIEKIGNLNYPEEARRRKLSGKLKLDVGLYPDGSVESITIVRSSGKKLLDDAAIRIVKLAAPFAPFPTEMRADTDVLVISRVWEFAGTGSFSSK